jgi:hypothetical protein
MTLLHLLIISSIAAGAAFFLAGYLLRSPRGDAAALAKEIRAREALAAELMVARSQHTTIEQSLAEVRALGAAAEGARVGEEEKRIAAERDRDRDRHELERLRTAEQTLAERLRIAEDHNRAAFEREEKTAAGWQEQLAQAQAERQRQQQSVRQELEELRARCSTQQAEHQRLREECRDLQAKEVAARRALEDLRARSEAQIQVQGQASTQESQRLAAARRAAEEHEAKLVAQFTAEKERLEAAVRAAEQREAGTGTQLTQEKTRLEAAVRAAEQRAVDTLAELTQGQAAWQAKAAAADEALRAQQAGLQAELRRLAQEVSHHQDECGTLREQNQSLSLAASAAQEELARARAAADRTAEALRTAEEHLTDRDRMAQENAELREERAQAQRESERQAGQEDEAREVKVQLAAAQAKLAEMANLLEENRGLRDEVSDLRLHQQASSDLERLTAEHKQLRLDAELMARRLQELQHDQSELGPLRAQAADAAALVEEVAYLRRREKDLEAQIYASGFRTSRELPAISDEAAPQTPMTDMESNLHSLVGRQSARTAVLADAQGFLIASAGDSSVQEGLAAFAAVAGDLVSRARNLLPLTSVESVRVTDANATVLTCHLFESEGQALGLATLGAGEPAPESTAQAIVGLASLLSSGESEPTT